jgi:hopene-associated glycosyltransferase HpnB
MILSALSLLPLGLWAYLLFGRGWFWLCRERDKTAAGLSEARLENAPDSWPSVVAIIPARDEADMIAESVGSLLRQDYPGRFAVVVVDDQSSDGTAAAASAAASAAGAADRLSIVAGSSPPPGWTGKLWAMRQGLAAVDAGGPAPEFVLFSDADIAYLPHVLGRLVAIARARGSVLTSLMVKLRCESAAERWLAPAFVFFFQMLYPFAWVNDPRRRTAAAAGGCMLARREALAAAGGLEAVRGALIDDCALAALMKRQGPVWLGLTEDVDSLRAYPGFGDFRRMVARSAFAELRYSAQRLVGAVAGMGLAYLAPALFAMFAHGLAQAAGAVAWAMMALALAPTLHLYRRSLASGLALPAIAAAYVAFTLDSAVQYWRGRGGYWKGRIQAPMREAGRA